MKIVIKVGTQAILTKEGIERFDAMENLVRQIATLKKAGHSVILVSSGAVGKGRQVVKENLGLEYGHSMAEKQVLASIGQPVLLETYSRLLHHQGMLGSQLLLTKQCFHTRQHYLNIARILRVLLESRHILPIINENDSVAIEEHMFTDNDELAGLVASQLNADKLVILTGVKGVYDGHPDDPRSQLISVLHPCEKEWPQVSALKSHLGRGGMLTKLGIARKMADLGITTHITCLDEEDGILKILAGDSLGTTILPVKRKSNIKRWIAWTQGQQRGAVIVNERLFHLLKENKKVISLLPVGLEQCRGDFKRGDLVEIETSHGRKIGVGIARYGADVLQSYLGQKGKPAFIHYDHLHLQLIGEENPASSSKPRRTP